MKQREFTDQQRQLAVVTKALSHPARVAVLEFLATEQDSCYFGILEEMIPLSKATLSQHLAELKEAGFLTGEPEGTKVRYSINREMWQASQKLLGDFFANIMYKRIH